MKLPTQGMMTMLWLQVYWNKDKTKNLYDQLHPGEPEKTRTRETSRRDRKIGGTVGISGWMKAMLDVDWEEGRDIESAAEFVTSDGLRLISVLAHCWQPDASPVIDGLFAPSSNWEPKGMVFFEGCLGIGPSGGRGEQNSIARKLKSMENQDWCIWEGQVGNVTLRFSTTLKWINATQLRQTLDMGIRPVWGLGEVLRWDSDTGLLSLDPVVIGSHGVPIRESV